MRSRSEVVKLAQSWIGRNEKDGSHKYIIDIYNSFNGPLPRNVKMSYTMSWCACTWSALAIQLGYTDIMPIEVSCGELIKLAQKMGIWVENDAYVPLPGDAILYDWDDKGGKDNTGWPEHIGIVDYVNEASGYFTVVEGNYNDAVKKRTVSINGKFIRGFISPKYDEEGLDEVKQQAGKSVETVAREAIVGIWGNMPKRKADLEKAGYDYDEVQAKINEILNVPDKVAPEVTAITTTCKARQFARSIAGTYKTNSDVNCRNDAGKNKKSLCKIPKGTKVQCFGYYSTYNNVRWYLIQFKLGNITYTGFTHSGYLSR